MTFSVRLRALRASVLKASAIVAVTLVAYLPVMSHGGFFWDDDSFLYANKLIHAPDGLWRFWFTKQPTDYFPLTSSVLWFEWRLWGNHPCGYHVINVLLHAAAAVLLWRVLLRLELPGAWLAGLIFAVHPVAAASAAWITEMKNTLPMTLYLLTILAWMKAEGTQSAECRAQNAEQAADRAPRVPSSAFCILQSAFCTPSYLLSLVLFLLALLAKPSVVMLPAILLLIAWWRRGTISLKDLARSVPFFALSLALGLVTIWFQHSKAIAVGEIVRPEGIASRIAAAGWIAWFYLYKVLLPAGLCVIYPRWDVSGSSASAFLPLAVLIAGLVWLWTRRKSPSAVSPSTLLRAVSLSNGSGPNGWGRAPFFAAAYFLISLLPVLGFVNTSFMVNSLVADHLQYVAMIGVIAFAAGVLARLASASAEKAPLGVLASACCVILLGVLTWNRAALYGDDRAMWQDNVAKNPSAPLAWNNLGWTFYRDGDYEKAVEDFSRAISLEPNNGMALNNRAGVYAILGKFDLALADCNEAIKLMPKVARAWNNRGSVFLQTHHPHEAIHDYDEAIRLNPNYLEACAHRAEAWMELKDYDKAWADVEKLRRLGGVPDPDFLRSLIAAGGRSE